MEIFYYAVIFVFGLLVGSFLNVAILRLGTGESLMGGRSHCVRCKKDLSWKDLLPLLSFLILRGKCRYCKRKISLQYALVEATTSLLFLLVALKLALPADALEWIALALVLCVAACFIVISFRDIRTLQVDNELLIVLLGASVALVVGEAFRSSVDALTLVVGPILVITFFIFLSVATRGKGMGLGDAKLSFVVALFVGIYSYEMIILWLFLAFVAGGIVGSAMIFFGIRSRKDALPLAPFLLSSATVVFFVGNEIWEEYMSLLAL